MDWSKLNKIQLGKYGEYYAKMMFTKYGFDVYSAEVDDKGIDFVIRKNEKEYFDIQVKAIRGYNFVFMRKKYFKPRQNLLVSLLVFKKNEEPTMLLFPSMAWKQKRYKYLVDYDYKGKKSAPEYAVRMSRKNMEAMKEEFSSEKQLRALA